MGELIGICALVVLLFMSQVSFKHIKGDGTVLQIIWLVNSIAVIAGAYALFDPEFSQWVQKISLEDILKSL